MPSPSSDAFVLTGATSGLGLALAAELVRRTDALVVAGARSPGASAKLEAAVPRGRLRVLPLDLGDLASARAFPGAVRAALGEGGRVAGIACVAGLQIIGPKRLAPNGVEMTFLVNHLGHVAIVGGLMDRLAPGATVATVGSGTENEDDRVARTFGFRGAAFPDARAVAAGDLGRAGTDAQQGLDRYATSKLCAVLFARDMARRTPAAVARFVAFDPGLMPGTGLARDRTGVERFAWSYVMPAVIPFASWASTPARSARALADALLGPNQALSGSYVDFHGRPARRGALSQDDARAADLHDTSLRLLAGERP